MVKSNLEASVGMSRKWDAREAGREVARSTIEKLKAPPNFFILFSTMASVCFNPVPLANDFPPNFTTIIIYI